ncbi:MAG: ParA family protein [Candidatus Spechtbacteria bacterium]|nr:ParA family protein [Candidatus Spechtbacteria bacterium]
MGKVITLCNQKGGTGKTTTAVNLGVYLAAKGKRTLLIDLDPQANATSALSLQPHRISPNLYHSLVGGVLPEDIVRETGIFGYHVFPSSPDLAGASVELVTQKNREFRLYDIVSRLRNVYDFILIDCPPSLGLLTLNGLVAADEVIIPVQCEYYAMEGLGQILETVDLIRDNLQRDVKVMGALLTMYDKRNRLARYITKELRRNFPGYVFDAVIPRNVSLAEAPGYGKTIFQFDPDSQGARAYQQFADEVIKVSSGAPRIII